MKKILLYLLLLCSISTFAQAEFPEGIQLSGNASTANSTKLLNQNPSTGTLDHINATSLPVSTATANALDLRAENSSGAIQGFAITNNGNGTVNIATGTAYLRTTNDPYSPLIKYVIPAVTNLALTDNANNFVLVDYNSGSPALTVTISSGTVNTTTNSIAYVISRVGTTLDYISLVGQNVDSNAKLRRRFLNSEGLRRANGAVLTASNRNLILTAGLYYSGLIEVPTPAFNTSTGSTFTYAYENTGVWTRTTGNTQINNTQYSLNGVLTAIPTNDYRVDYTYILADNPSKLYVLLGTTTYANISLARLAPVPTNLPSELQVLGTRVGRSIIQKDATTTETTSEFATIYQAGTATLHNDLGGLNMGDFQHLTVAEKANMATKDEVILQDASPQTKIGSLTLGENLTHANDNWMAFGTSITSGGKYTAPMSKQLSLVLNNFGISGSNTASLVGNFTNIPTLNSGNIDNYRLLTIEHGINDALGFNPIPTFKENITNFILDAKAKGWANNKILVINSNYCSRVDLDTELEPYAIASIEVAIEQGVQYVDIYNYTKNNGGGDLLIDGVHLSDEGGRVYARGVISLMYGGLEVSNGLNVINGIRGSSIYLSEDSEINGIDVGKGLGDMPTNTVFGEDALISNTTGYDNTAIGFEALKNNTTGRGILANGYQALKNNTTGVFLTANGYQALMSNNTGVNNTANGFGSLSSNTTGGANTANGMLSMSSNVSGNENTANGMFSILANINGNRNTSNGYASLSSNIDGNDNTGNGNYALGSNISGDDNTALGNKAGFHFNASSPLTNPSNSIFVGSQTRALADNGVNEIVIGYNVVGQGSNSTSIGNPSTVTTKIYGDIVSPSLTGNPTAPTPTLGDNDTSIATTAFVQSTTNSNAVLLTGNQTVVGLKSFNNGSSIAGYFINDTSNTDGALAVRSSSSGLGQSVLNQSNGTGVLVQNQSNGTGIKIKESSTGVGLLIESDISSTTNTPIKVTDYTGSELFSINRLGLLKVGVFTVATLPTPTGTAYATVTDALAPTYMATVVGGGAVVTPVFYNGTNWVAH